MNKVYSFLLPLCLTPIWLTAQPDWTQIVPRAFARLDQEAADSIASIRQQCVPVRAALEALVLHGSLNRLLIAGPDDQYLKEGMSKYFVRDPQQMEGHYERDTAIVRLENLHINLYLLDKRLFRWLDLATRLKEHPDRRQFGFWALQYRSLPPEEALRLRDPQRCANWVTDQVVCEMASTMQSDGPNATGKRVRSFDPKFEQPTKRPGEQPARTPALALPLPPEVIQYSFPVNGQYSFRRDESIPGVGYVILPGEVRPVLDGIAYSNTTWYARWCSARGQVSYTACDLRMGNQFFFNLPDEAYFLPGELYRLEIIATPTQNTAPLLPTDVCWQIFRGQPTRPLNTQIRLPEEVKVTELFFRAGKYALRDKLNTIKGSIDWQTGNIRYQTDEPFDALELYGSGSTPAFVQFYAEPEHFDEDALDARDLYYYLTVPEVENLDTLPLSTYAIAEQDNTAGALFLLNPTETAVNNFIHLPNHAQQALRLAGGYLAPPHSTAFAADSLACSAAPPFITRRMFEKNKAPRSEVVGCVLKVGELRQLVAAATLQQQQISRRMEERARFFYQLEVRKAQRENRSVGVSLDDLRKRERDNLPKSAKTVYEAHFPEVFQRDFTIYYSRFFPGSQQRTALLSVKFNPQ